MFPFLTSHLYSKIDDLSLPDFLSYLSYSVFLLLYINIYIQSDDYCEGGEQ